MSENVNSPPDVPAEVVHAIQQFVDHLHGRRTDPLDLDTLAPDIRTTVEDLLPLIAAEAITGDLGTPGDLPPWEDDQVVHALGLQPVPGRTRLRGDGVRRAREAAGLSLAELAQRVSGRGVTIDARFLGEVELRPGSPVDPKLADAIAAELGVNRPSITFADDVLDTTVQDLIAEISWVRPDIHIRTEDMVVGGGRRPLAALHLEHLGFVVRLGLFDVDESDLWSREVMTAAAATLDVDPDVTVLLAAARAEWPTQIVDAADLANAYVAPSGRRLQIPRRPILPIGDAVRLLFEEALPLWDDVDLGVASKSDLNIGVVGIDAARQALAAATSARPRLEPKVRGLELVRTHADEAAVALASLIDEVREGNIAGDALAVRLLELLPVAS
jgi:transcriptional regulator with XRE-family HTH domain